MKLDREEFKENLIEACADKDQYISVDDLERFLDLNYDEDSSLAEWNYRDFADFATELAANFGDLRDTCHAYDFKCDEVFKVRVYNIDYDIKEEDVDDDLSIEYVRSLLPNELELEVECLEDDLEDMLVDAISDETGWLVNSYKYEIITGSKE